MVRSTSVLAYILLDAVSMELSTGRQEGRRCHSSNKGVTQTEAPLLPHLTPVSLGMGETLYEMEGSIRHVYFPDSSVVSLVTHMDEGTSVEAGLIGSEGMVGLSVVMGDDVSQNHAVVQIADGAMRTGR
jgi:hypothetical protein